MIAPVTGELTRYLPDVDGHTHHQALVEADPWSTSTAARPRPARARLSAGLPITPIAISPRTVGSAGSPSVTTTSPSGHPPVNIP